MRRGHSAPRSAASKADEMVWSEEIVMGDYDTRVDGELRCIIDSCKDSVRIVPLTRKQESVGFCAISQNRSAFFPGKCILQLRIQDAWLTYRNEIWRSITENHDIEMAIASTEDITSLSIFLDHQKQTKLAALGFEHGGNLEEATMPGGFEVEKAKEEDIKRITNVWRRIFQHHRIDAETNAGEILRTERQVLNGDVWYVREKTEVVGFGVANFRYETNGRVEIGFALDPDYWGRGLGTALAVFLKRTCQERGKEAVAHCHYAHTASTRILEKAGMVPRHRRMEFRF